MVHSGTQLHHALMALLAAVLLSACAARDPVAHVDPADVRCPELSGSYCATGRMYERGVDQLSSVALQFFLPVGDKDPALNQKIWAADRIDLLGGHDGQLTIKLLAEGQPVSSVTLAAGEFRCGTDTLLLENPGQMWGGVGPPMLPIFGVGWSDAHSLLWKSGDGSLRARKLRRNSGTVMLAIPVNINEEFWARFKLADGGCAQP